MGTSDVSDDWRLSVASTVLGDCDEMEEIAEGIINPQTVAREGKSTSREMQSGCNLGALV